MKCPLPCVVLLALSSAPGAFAGLLYDNTTTDTGNTLLYSAGLLTASGARTRLQSRNCTALIPKWYFSRMTDNADEAEVLEDAQADAEIYTASFLKQLPGAVRGRR